LLPNIGEIAQFALGFPVLLLAAHAVGHLFTRLRQPKVIGEIVGGLILGPTLLARIVPEQMSWPFPKSGELSPLFVVVYQFGLILLMFVSGSEVRASFQSRERRVVGWITFGGTALPFIAGLYFASLLNAAHFEGSAHVRWSFLLVVGIAVAVTSIPVISRIMLDLGILKTAFARLVLAAAILEDVLLYVVLAVAIGLVVAPGGIEFGVAGLLDLSGGWSTGYHVIATIIFFSAGLLLVPRLYRRVVESRYNLVERVNAAAFQVLFLLVMTFASVFLGVAAIFGALIAGLVAGSTSEERTGKARETIKKFGMAIFIPAYFGLVGARLDLLNEFAPLFFLGFLAFACGVKTVGVYLGARVGQQSPPRALNLAVAMNARGGPGIVVASVAFDAEIINQGFFGVLVMLALVTSLIAGIWLQRAIRVAPDLFAENASPQVTTHARSKSPRETTRGPLR
jgi:Kef-type K+ transport system membrane component KefB